MGAMGTPSFFKSVWIPTNMLGPLVNRYRCVSVAGTCTHRYPGIHLGTHAHAQTPPPFCLS